MNVRYVVTLSPQERSDFPRHRDLAEKLRDYLEHEAKVARAELFISDSTRLNLRFHDLRASTVTWMGVRCDSTERIMQRVGHEDWPTMKKYLRTAEALAEGFGEVFPSLPSSIIKPSDPGGSTPGLIQPSDPGGSTPGHHESSDESSLDPQLLGTTAGRTGLEPSEAR